MRAEIKLAIATVCVAYGLVAGAVTTLRGVDANCEGLAVVIYDATQMRDAGLPWTSVQPWITEQLEIALKNPKSYVRTKDDSRYVLDTIKSVWDSERTASDLGQAAYDGCMKGNGPTI